MKVTIRQTLEPTVVINNISFRLRMFEVVAKSILNVLERYLKWHSEQNSNKNIF